MDTRLLQLNIYKGKKYENLVKYLKQEDFDIICLQEVSGNKMGYISLDIFEDLKKKLDLSGEIIKATNFTGDDTSYFGNAILYKKNLHVNNKRILWMKEYEEVTPENQEWDEHPRGAIALDFMINNKPVTVISTHLAWGISPLDKPYKTLQANKLIEFIKNINNSIVLAGDFNLIAQTNIIQSFSKILRNLTAENNLKNTLNPNVHEVRELFPRGLAVDYIFVTSDLKINEFNLVNTPDLSDHFGLKLTFQV